MIDHNRDGFIDKEDLHDMLASLGKVKGHVTCFLQLQMFTFACYTQSITNYVQCT